MNSRVPSIASSNSPRHSKCHTPCPIRNAVLLLLVFGGVLFTLTDVYAQGEIVFQTTGSSFAAILDVEAGATIEWTFHDATTSDSATPNKDYGSEALRDNRLRVTPWSALTGINIGYDAGDGGPNTIPFLDQQNVVAVTGLENVAPYLELWCSSYNPLTTLDFSNFVHLTEIECFLCQSLSSVNLSNTPMLSRACFEDNDLASLDLSESPALADLRGAMNTYTAINWGTTGDQVWHICVRDNPQMTSNLPDMSQFPLLMELFVWNDNQTGVLHPTSTHLTSVQAFENHYTAADFTGTFPAGRNGEISIQHNDLTSLIVADCPGLMRLNAANNNLGRDAIDLVLATLDAFNTHGGTLDLHENTGPSTTGRTHANNLIDRGWSVTLDEGGEEPGPPVLSAISYSASTTSASITWKTNTETTSTVEYGTTSAYGSVVSSSGMSRYHFAPLTGLTPNTPCHFRITATDMDDLSSTSGDCSFTTRATGTVYWEDDFHRPDGDVGNGWTGINEATAIITDNVMRRTDSGNYRILYHPAGGSLPADYYVTMMLPHTTITRSWWGLMGRYLPPGSDMGSGNKVFWMSQGPLTLGAGHASFDNDLTITVTNGYPASWSQSLVHTVTLGYAGEQVTIYLDGHEYGYFNDTTNNIPGTGVACVGDGVDTEYNMLDIKVTDFLPTFESITPFHFTSEPNSDWKTEGQRLELTVTVEGNAGNLTYQWSLNGTPIPGATDATLLLNTLTPEDAGIYICTVTDNSNNTVIQSQPAHIQVYPTSQLPLGGLLSTTLLGAFIMILKIFTRDSHLANRR